MSPVAFYCRAKPQRADALEIFQQARRVFIGYPMLRRGAQYDPRNMCTCLVDPTCPDDEWNRELHGQSRFRRAYSRNRNFVKQVGLGSIVLIPRPEHGAAYLGRVTGPFEIVNTPSWAEDYLQLRRRARLDDNDEKNCHIADVAQGWPVEDGYVRVDLSSLPGWIRRSLFGRSMFGRLGPHPLDNRVTAHAVLEGILNRDTGPGREWTLDPVEIRHRLVDSLNPSSFENLVISLLQLENPQQIWQHTGGSGDGGIDGMGSNGQGATVGLLQCKLYAGTAPEIAADGQLEPDLRRYSAVLIPRKPKPPSNGTELLDLDWVVERVRRHWRFLPQAISMRIGEPCTSA